MPSYRILSPLHHDGTAFAPGDVVPVERFSAEQEAHLVATGTIVLVEETPAEEPDLAAQPAEAAATPPPASSPRKGRREA